MSIYFPSDIINPSMFSCFYTLISFLILYPYFNNEKKYYILLIIFSLLIDIVYTNTFIFNMILFLILSIVIEILNNILPNNIFTINLKSLIITFLYHILSFIILNMISYDNYSFSMLFNILTNSIIMTIIYTTIIYLITKNIFKRYDKLIK